MPRSLEGSAVKYLIILRTVYLTNYYSSIGRRPNRSYALSVVISFISSFISSLIILFHEILNKNDIKSKFQFEALLSHGLSFEEWRNAKAVKEKMDRIQEIQGKDEYLPEEIYNLLLMILAFSGMIEYRPETPEEKSRTVVENLPREGEVLTSLSFDSSDENSTPTENERRVSREEARMFESMRQGHIEYLKDKYYKGVTLSRLIFEGVHLVFRRKKIGPKKPTRTQAFMKAFGLNTQ